MKYDGSAITHHHFEELEIFGASNFSDVVEKHWKLCQVDDIRQLCEDPLDAPLEQLNNLI